MLTRAAMLMAGEQALGAPLEFDAEADCVANPTSFTGDRANLSWTDNPQSPGASTQVWRQLDGSGGFSLIDTVGVGVEEYQDVPGDVDSAQYQIRHVRFGQASEYAGPESVQIDAGCS